MSAACRVLGHQMVFTTEGPVMHFHCERDCGTTGYKTYPSAADSSRYAAAFNRRDSDAVGKRAPLIGMLPLRLWRRLKSLRAGSPNPWPTNQAGTQKH